MEPRQCPDVSQDVVRLASVTQIYVVFFAELRITLLSTEVNYFI